MRQLGTVIVWKDDHGFGFIRPASQGEDVFFHATDLLQKGHQPVIGESVSFEIATRDDGKTRAVRVHFTTQIEASRPGSIRPKQERIRPERIGPRPAAGPWKGIAILLLIGVVFLGAKQYISSQSAPIQPSAQLVAQKEPEHFTCDGRTYCSQMTFCAEAKYFLNNCPNTKMDGDHDGVPCERQWC